MLPRIEQFIREREYLNNVSPATLQWYRESLKWLPSESPTQAELNEALIQMRTKGRKATGCNCTVRAINAYMHWSTGSERKCGPSCSHPRIRQLKEPQNVLPTLSDAQVNRLVGWKPKPKSFYQRRLHLLALFLLDVGCRISEALKLRVSDVDLDNLLVTLDGKGSKRRIVPFSLALRKAVYRFITDFSLGLVDLLFGTRVGADVGVQNRDNVRRDVTQLCRKLGFQPPPRVLHCFRHSYAINYLRRGGSVFHLQKALGHSTLEMTRRYANLVVADLQAVHERVSLLARG